MEMLRIYMQCFLLTLVLVLIASAARAYVPVRIPLSLSWIQEDVSGLQGYVDRNWLYTRLPIYVNSNINIPVCIGK